MLYLLNKDVRTVRWNGEPLHEATSAIVKEIMNGDFTLTVKYPISDSGIYQLIQEDMLIKAPTPVLGAQLFRIKKPVEHNDHLEITAYHISDDVMQRSITPVSVTSQSCGMALSRMVQNTKTALGDFSFNSDIQDRRTFNTTETETLYSVLLDGKHSIVGTWEGELVRDNFAMTVKKSRGENRGVVITTHKNLKDYQRTKNSQNVVTRIHAKSTFKPEGAEKETTIRVTVDSPLINSYPYINEKEYENNNAKSVEELQKWAQAKFSNEGIDKVSDAIKIEAYELDGQVVHMGDTVNLKSWKHNVDVLKKAIAYEFDALKEEYISLTFDDKAGVGGSRASGGLSSAADAILGATESAQEIAIGKALQNADLDFDHKVGLLRQEISDGIELARAKTEEVKRELSDTIDQRFSSFNNGPLQEIKSKAIEALRNSGASSLLAQEAKRIGLDSIAKLEEFKTQATSAQMALSGDLDALKRTIANDIRPKQVQAEAEIAKQVESLVQTKKELAGVKSAQATYEETTTRRMSELTNLTNGKASRSELVQTADELVSRIASVSVGGVNLFKGSRDFSGSWVNVGQWTKETEKYKGLTVMSRTGLWLGLSQPFEAKKGETYTFSFYIKSSAEREQANVYFVHNSTSTQARVSLNVSSLVISNEWQRLSATFKIEESGFILPRIERFNADNRVYVAGLKLEHGTIATDYNENPEDVDGRVSAVESNFKQRADSLDAGVNRLTEGLRTKADISSLNVTAENIRQSVKSLETNTQNKLDQKLSLAEFEVRAGSIRQEILNATKDKADKTLVTTEAGKIREEFSKMKVGGRNLWIKSKTVGAVIEKLPENHVTGQKECYRLENNATLTFNIEPDFSSRLNQKVTYSAWIKFENVVQGQNFWNAFNCFKHYLFRKNSKTGIQNGPDYTTLGVYTGSSDWKYITFTYDYSENQNFDQLKTSLRFNLEGATSGTAWVTGIKVEIGSVATDYSPALEDGEAELLVAKTEFKKTADGLSTKIAAVESYVGQDGQRQEALRRYTREESARQATAVRELVTRDYVGKASHQEDVRAIERRFEAITNPQNGSIATQIAKYKTAVDGRFADITSLLSGKASQVDFQKVKETSQLYERILGNTENGIADKVARMALTNQLFQVEVSKNEGLKTVQRQLAGSWSVQNINSAGDLISGINLGANGYNRFDGKLTHITGETLIDKAVIKSAMVDKLKTANFEAGSVTTVILDAEAVTAEKLKVDQALFNKLVANEAYLSQLFAKQAFINRVQSVAIDASQVRSGILSGDRIYGGTIRGANIFGGTLTGHTKIQLGSYGSFDTVNGGLQINVPRDYNAKDGLGVQFIGSYGRGENVPYGLFIYKDSDFTTGGYASRSDDFLLTVEGYIKANGIGWFKTGKGSINGSSTATIGYWNSSVSLDFGGSGNDIYYSYNGKAYSLWTIVNQHFSDRRLKENIVDCKHKALDYIQQFKFKEYDWKKQEDRPQQAHTKIGLIAQEVQAVDPTLVYENGDTLNLDNLRLTNIALKAIQELALENKTLTHRLENLENEHRTA